MYKNILGYSTNETKINNPLSSIDEMYKNILGYPVINNNKISKIDDSSSSSYSSSYSTSTSNLSETDSLNKKTITNSYCRIPPYYPSYDQWIKEYNKDILNSGILYK